MNRSLAVRSLLVYLALAPWAAGCSVGATGQVGYSLLQLGGDLGLERGGGAITGSQTVDDAFGLGQSQGSPYVRGQLDGGGPVLTASALWLQEDGSGTLTDTFGGLASGSQADTSLDLGVLKVGASYDFDLGLVKVSPGVMCDVVALDFRARDVASGSQEAIDELVVAPMPFVRAEAGLGPVTAVGELGYLDVSGLSDIEGTFLDAEVLLEWHPVPFAHVFAGYRHVDLDGSGDAGSDRFAADLHLQGWTIGGGVRF